MHVLSMNAPSSAPSIKYSLQCALIASTAEADGASAVTRNACSGDKSACKEVADHCRDLLRVGFEREVTRIEKMNYGIGNIASERLSTGRQKKRIILSPCCEEP